MIPMTELLENMVKNLEETFRDVKVYKCPSCDKRFDLETVRKITENGEAPVCMDCGEDLVFVEEGDE